MNKSYEKEILLHNWESGVWYVFHTLIKKKKHNDM